MKKIPNLAALILAILLGGLMKSSALAISAPVPNVTLTLPASSVDFEDLDVRDELNRPITSEEKKAALRNLFVSRLNQLLLLSLTPVKARVASILQAKWDPTDGWIKAISQALTHPVAALLQKKIWELFQAPLTRGEVVPPVSREAARPSMTDSPHQDLLSIFVATTILLR